jgi:DNA-binding HxlR family transcriptional regulator
MGLNKISCSLESCLELLNGKWKLCILTTLFDKPHRFGEIRKKLPNITIKMLSQALKDLTNSELIVRWDHNTRPPKVLYSISTFGKTLKPLIEEIERWENENLAQIQKSLIKKQYNKYSKEYSLHKNNETIKNH